MLLFKKLPSKAPHILITILSMLIVITIIISVFRFKPKEQSVESTSEYIDLKGYNLNEDRVFSLNGVWRFYNKKYYYTEDFIDNEPAEGVLVNLPHIWNRESNYTSFNHGTYRLVIDIDNPGNNTYSLNIATEGSAVSLFLNGRLLNSIGKNGIDKDTSVVGYGKQTVVAPFRDRENEIIIHVSNYHLYNGGLNGKIELGSIESIKKQNFINSYTINLYIAFFIVLGLLILIVFILLLNKQDNNTEQMLLYNGITLITIGIRMFITGRNGLLVTFLDNPILLIKTDYIILLFMAYLISTQIYFYKEKSISPIIIYGYHISLVFLSFIVLFLPVLYVSNILFSISFLSILGLFFIIDRKTKTIIITGLLSLLLVAVYDIFNLLSFSIPGYKLLLYYWPAFFTLLLTISLLKNIFKVSSENLIKSLQRPLYSGSQNEENQIKSIDLTPEKQLFLKTTEEIIVPLSLISSPIDSIIKGDYGDTINRSDKLLKVISDSANKIHTIINEMLQLFYDKKPENLDSAEIFCVNSTIENYIKQISPVIMLKDITLNFIKPDNKIFIKMNSEVFQKVFLDIIIFIFRFCNKDENILVSIKNTDTNYFIIDINNSTSKASSKDMYDLFKKYNIKYMNNLIEYFEDKQDLNIIFLKNRIERNGGKLNGIFDKKYGIKFSIIFPAIKDIDIPDILPKASKINPLNIDDLFKSIKYNLNNDMDQSKPSIMIIDNSYDMIFYLESRLRNKYRIIKAYSGSEAINLFKSGTIVDLVLCDLNTDVFDAYQILEILSQIIVLRNTPVFVFSNSSDESTKINILSKGAVDYLEKPFSFELLEAKIGVIITKNSKLKEQYENDLKKKFFKIIDSKTNSDQLSIIDDSIFASRIKDFNLTDRETAVVRELLNGLEAKEIGDKLNIAYKTVKNHVHSIYKACGINNRIELYNIFK